MDLSPGIMSLVSQFECGVSPTAQLHSRITSQAVTFSLVSGQICRSAADTTLFSEPCLVGKKLAKVTVPTPVALL
jgi:hypothetical protein